jgi:methyl-galactoside transport system substrate-binding protein
MIELVIANNDDMALGAVSALQGAGYNKQGGKVIPVFGVDATEAAKSAIAEGSMIGTIKQDAEGMADAILKIAVNLKNGEDKFSGIPKENIQGSWRVNIPYAEYTGEK